MSNFCQSCGDFDVHQSHRSGPSARCSTIACKRRHQLANWDICISHTSKAKRIGFVTMTSNDPLIPGLVALHKRPAHFDHLHLRRIQKPAARRRRTPSSCPPAMQPFKSLLSYPVLQPIAPSCVYHRCQSLALRWLLALRPWSMCPSVRFTTRVVGQKPGYALRAI